MIPWSNSRGELTRRGQLLARLCAGAWRDPPPPLDMSEEELAEIVPLVRETGGAGLGWWRVSASPLRDTPSAQALHDVHRLIILRNAQMEREIRSSIHGLRAQGIEPILIKGWAIARHYPQRGLRQHGDVDLCVRPRDFDTAYAARLTEPARVLEDLHRGFAKPDQPEICLEESPFEEIFARSQLVNLGDVDVRVPCPEDHLRILCRHMFMDGAWRAIWLTDVAVALESIDQTFDWDLCLARNHRRSDWVACAIGLAHQLLGARVDSCPAPEVRDPVPWLVPSILEQWGRGVHERFQEPFKPSMFHPVTALNELRQRWPRNRLDVAARWPRPLRAMPWWRLAVTDSFSRGVGFLARTFSS